MSFGENLQFLRKKNEMTQEQLAEKLEVSRQSISKWESSNAFPEMEKLLQICELFSCNMDTLMRGNAEEMFREDRYDYDGYMNRFSIRVAAGVGLLLLGVTALLALQGVGISDTVATMVFLIFAVVAILNLVLTGIQHDSFVKKHPYLEDFYSEEEKERFNSRFAVRVTVSIGLILIGVVWTVGSEELPLPKGWNDDIYTAVFLLLVTIAVSSLVYNGIQRGKYEIEKYNQENCPGAKAKERNEKIGKWCGCIMIVACAVYVGLGFTLNLWGTAWVVFPIGGLLCGVASIILSKEG